MENLAESIVVDGFFIYIVGGSESGAGSSAFFRYLDVRTNIWAKVSMNSEFAKLGNRLELCLKQCDQMLE